MVVLRQGQVLLLHHLLNPLLQVRLLLLLLLATSGLCLTGLLYLASRYLLLLYHPICLLLLEHLMYLLLLYLATRDKCSACPGQDLQPAPAAVLGGNGTGGHKLCILVPFKDRFEELLEFAPYISSFLTR